MSILYLFIGFVLGFVLALLYAKKRPEQFAAVESHVPLHPAVPTEGAVPTDPLTGQPLSAQTVNKTQA